ncbi:MAG: hypothetical protein JWP11_44 [Frankiales bacterium]|nr:hypothetical protein [Frankiales bacterium]
MTDAETTRLYDSLPEFMQAADEQLDGHPLLSFVAGIGAQLQTIATLLGRLNRYADQTAPAVPSDLADADGADPQWLDWLAQTVGAHLGGVSDLAARRDAVRSAAAGWRVGTRTAVADAARSALTGTKHVEIHDHTIASPGDGGPWDVLLVTAASETPDPSAVLAAVVAKGAKPAGVVLHHRAYSATWAQVEAAYPTWADIEGKTWQQLEETGL